ncbi:MAG: DeoR/GlpR transcriptional regulator [Blautia sp.]|nr:DeoR/GlpR transcriptional regulator [Blautia sp.]
MLAIERRNLILQKLHEEKRVVVSQLSQMFGVSEETIRRDLDKLEKDGVATKSYGGAVINEELNIDMPFNIRKNQNISGKQKMAETAASIVKDGEHIFLDASSTAVFIARALKEKERLTVLTNSVEILLELSDMSGWTVISTGGVMKEGFLAFFGSRSEEAIRTFQVDKVFCSCKALDPVRGIMESREEIASAKRAMLASGEMRILAADSTKFDQKAFVVCGSLRDINVLITDKKPSEEWLQRLDREGIQCLYQEEENADI